MKRYFLLYVLCFTWQIAFTSVQGTADSILSDLRVEISPLQYNGLYHRRLSVEQTFDITCTTEKEKIVLQQNAASMLAQILWNHSLTTAVFGYHQWLSTPRRQLRKALSELQFDVLIDGKQCTSYKYDIINKSQGQLVIPVRNKGRHTITLRYDFINNNNMPMYIMDTETRLSFFQFGGWQESWFFVADSMRWGNVEVIMQDSTLYFFADVPARKQENSFRLYPTSTSDIRLFFLDKNLYDEYTIRTDYSEVKVYMQRAFQFEAPDRITNITQRMPDSILQQNISNLHTWLEELETFFVDSVERSICFLERDFTMMFNTKVSMGATYCRNPSSYIIVCDKNFWRSPHISHELAHIFMQYKYEDDVYYLFSEAFVEYIATYVYDNKDSDEMERTFEFYYNRLTDEQKTLRILGQKKAFWGSEQVAYSRVPYTIHQFANRIGFERFISILQGYFRHVRIDDITISLADFETYLKAHGVSDEDWEWLYNAL